MTISRKLIITLSFGLAVSSFAHAQQFNKAKCINAVHSALQVTKAELAAARKQYAGSTTTRLSQLVAQEKIVADIEKNTYLPNGYATYAALKCPPDLKALADVHTKLVALNTPPAPTPVAAVPITPAAPTPVAAVPITPAAPAPSTLSPAPIAVAAVLPPPAQRTPAHLQCLHNLDTDVLAFNVRLENAAKEKVVAPAILKQMGDLVAVLVGKQSPASSGLTACQAARDAIKPQNTKLEVMRCGYTLDANMTALQQGIKARLGEQRRAVRPSDIKILHKHQQALTALQDGVPRLNTMDECHNSEKAFTAIKNDAHASMR